LSKTSPQKFTISRDDIRAVYAQGEDAVIALVEGLLERIVVLEKRVEALENQISKNSRNSSKAPSSDGCKPRVKSQRRKSERSSGGQLGHPGANVDRIPCRLP
jgi:transposase